MSEGRALLTDRERAALAGDETDNYLYKTRTYVRRRLDKLEKDVDHLAEHEPELLDELRDIVCDTDVPAGDEVHSETHPAPQSPGREQNLSEERQPIEPTPGENPRASRSGPEPSDELSSVVDTVAEGWEDSNERLAARKAAALAVLQYAQEHGGVSKQEAKEQVYPQYPVQGQNARTWYRKNIRPVLSEVAIYNQSKRRYELQK